MSCLSPDGGLVAVVAPENDAGVSRSLRVLLFQRETGSLRTTLLRKQDPAATSSSSPDKRHKLLFIDDSLLALHHQGTIIVWDLSRGVLDFVIANEHSIQDMTVLAGSLYLLVSSNEGKLQIHQYERERLIRKIKVGKGEATSLAATHKYFAVRFSDSIRIFDSSNASRLCKISNLSPEHTDIVATTSHVMTVSQNFLTMYDITSGTAAGKIQIPSSQQTIALDLIETGRSQYRLSDGSSVYNVEDSGKFEKLTITSFEPEIDSHNVFCFSNKLVALLYQAGQFQVQTHDVMKSLDISFKSTSKSNSDDVMEDMEDGQSGSKRSILGPGHAGGEAKTTGERPEKKARTENGEKDEGDANEPTVAERLEQIQKILDEEDQEDDYNADELREKSGFQPKKATTESLTELIQQALQSNDDAMLELAVEVRDAKVIEATCENLSEDLLPSLLNALTMRLASKPIRADQLSTWISTILRSGRVRSVVHLQPLRNLIQERIEVFPALLQLEGRLSMMSNV